MSEVYYGEEPSSRFDDFKKFISKQFKAGNVEQLQGCKKCKGTGLNHYKYPNLQGTQEDYCNICKGSGVEKFDLKLSYPFYICKNCKGYGYLFGIRCSKCKGKGFADWVDAIVGDV